MNTGPETNFEDEKGDFVNDQPNKPVSEVWGMFGDVQQEKADVSPEGWDPTRELTPENLANAICNGVAQVNSEYFRIGFGYDVKLNQERASQKGDEEEDSPEVL